MSFLIPTLAPSLKKSGYSSSIQLQVPPPFGTTMVVHRSKSLGSPPEHPWLSTGAHNNNLLYRHCGTHPRASHKRNTQRCSESSDGTTPWPQRAIGRLANTFFECLTRIPRCWYRGQQVQRRTFACSGTHSLPVAETCRVECSQTEPTRISIDKKYGVEYCPHPSLPA